MKQTDVEEKGHGHSLENRSFTLLSKTGQQMNWGPHGFTFWLFIAFLT
jgi:hypothetical protein